MRLTRGRTALLGLGTTLAFLVVWQLASTLEWVNPLFISSPTRVLAAGVELARTGELWTDILISGQELLIGFGLAALLGIPIGIWLGWYRTLNAALGPAVKFLYATPRVALLPLIIIWVGIGVSSKIVIVFLSAFFQIVITTQSGVRTIDATLLRAARSYGASDGQIFRTIALPSSVPFIAAGLRLGVGHAVIGVVVGELYAAQDGVGHLIASAGALFQTDKVLFGVAIISTAGIALMSLFEVLESRFDRWRLQR